MKRLICLAILFTACEPEDEVVYQSPTYGTYGMEEVISDPNSNPLMGGMSRSRSDEAANRKLKQDLGIHKNQREEAEEEENYSLPITPKGFPSRRYSLDPMCRGLGLGC